MSQAIEKRGVSLAVIFSVMPNVEQTLASKFTLEVYDLTHGTKLILEEVVSEIACMVMLR